MYKFKIMVLLISCIMSIQALCQENYNTIEIRTRFSSFIGKPAWLLIVRDVDTGESFPYLFDITKGENYWIIPTHGFHYLITVSNVHINTYDASWNGYKEYEIKNFCHLESRGHIIHGKSALISIEGHLSRNSNDYRCKIQRW